VGGFLESWSLALLEAAAQCVTEGRPVLLAGYDIINKPPLSDVSGIDANFGCALLLEPATTAESAAKLNISIETTCSDQLSGPAPQLQPLLLLSAIRRTNSTGSRETQQWRLNSDSHLALTLSN
jgi:hypothetical protein